MIENAKRKTYSFLRWTERWTKTDMVYLAKGGFWMTFEKIILNLASLASSIIFANLLAKETYGVYQFVLSIFAILLIPSLTGMSSAVVQAVARGKEGTMLAAMKAKMLWGLGGLAAGLGISAYYFWQHDTTLGIAFIIASLFAPFMDSVYIYSALLNGRQDFKHYSIFNIISKSSPILLILITLLLTKNVLWILLAYLLFNTLSDVFLLIYSVKKMRPNKEVDGAAIGFGKHLSLLGVIGVISGQVDKILIFHYLGAAEVAIYIFSLMPAQKIQTFLGNLNSMILPRMSQRTIPELKKSIPKNIINLLVVIIPGVALYIAAAPFLFRLLFPHYMEAVAYSQIFALTLLFFPSNLFSQALMAQMKKKQLYFLGIISPVFKITLFFLLMPRFGIGGAVASLLTVEVLTFVFLVFSFYGLKNEEENKPPTF